MGEADCNGGENSVNLSGVMSGKMESRKNMGSFE
jgi:hypothetical protein